MVHALKVGDNVLTNGGIYGKISKLEENEVLLEVASGVVIRVDRMSVGGVILPEDKKSADKKAEKKVEKSENKSKKIKTTQK